MSSMRGKILVHTINDHYEIATLNGTKPKRILITSSALQDIGRYISTYGETPYNSKEYFEKTIAAATAGRAIPDIGVMQDHEQQEPFKLVLDEKA